MQMRVFFIAIIYIFCGLGENFKRENSYLSNSRSIQSVMRMNTNENIHSFILSQFVNLQVGTYYWSNMYFILHIIQI